MRDSRLSDLIRSLRTRGSLVIAGFALAFAVAAGLACDENAPTETPAAPTQLGATGDDPDLAVGDVTAQAIALPVNQSIATTAPAPAFRVNQTGTGPNGIFQITRSGSTQTALQGLTNGKGRAGFFQLTNTTNAQSALEAVTAGTGRAGLFRITNASNAEIALEATTAGSGPAGVFRRIVNGGFALISVSTASNAGAAHFQANTNFDAPFFPVVRVDQTGALGVGMDIRNRNPANAFPTLIVSNDGTGQAAGFSSNSNVETFSATNFGTGPVGRFSTFNSANTSDVLRTSTAGAGRAFSALQTGSGEAGRFEVSNAANGSTALTARTNGTGLAFEVEQGSSAFFGNVAVFGVMTKSAGSFRIDHPLDPEHKYLSHSFVESPDMMNVYNGNVALDANGRATVALPEYFEALNRDFRYQLTAIGAPGPNLYIAEGVKQNRFKIAGGRPYASVSWQVTGIRQDTYANEHRIKVEEDKPRAEGGLIARR